MSSRPFLRSVVMLACVATVALTTSASSAAPADDARARLAAAKAEQAAAQRAADSATARCSRLQSDQAELEQSVRENETRLRAERKRLTELRALAAERAVAAYKATGDNAPVASGLDADSAMELVRKRQYLASANDVTQSAVDRVRVAREDLDSREQYLRDARQRAAQKAAAAEAELGTIGRRLAAAKAATDRVDREVQQADAQAAARLAAARRAPRASAPTRAVTAAPVSPSPARGGLVCPVRGPVSFANDWMAPRPGGAAHEGTDIFSPRGTPNVAVVSGTITQKYGSRQGNGVHLNGDDGNLYYSFHLSAYAGGPRRVTQGEVIGFTGDTGATGAIHTHFEIHPGHGAAVNPYPTLRAIC